MKTFEERMALLEKALSKETPESLFEKLNEFEACGPNIVEFGKTLSKNSKKLKNK